LILYGINNCDTVKKSRQWLDAHSITYTFHDFRKQGLEKSTLAQWITLVPWETLLNKRSTTWRQLSDNIKFTVNERSILQEMLNQPTLIKRPILEYNKNIICGFNINEWLNFLDLAA